MSAKPEVKVDFQKLKEQYDAELQTKYDQLTAEKKMREIISGYLRKTIDLPDVPDIGVLLWGYNMSVAGEVILCIDYFRRTGKIEFPRSIDIVAIKVEHYEKLLSLLGKTYMIPEKKKNVSLVLDPIDHKFGTIRLIGYTGYHGETDVDVRYYLGIDDLCVDDLLDNIVSVKSNTRLKYLCHSIEQHCADNAKILDYFQDITMMVNRYTAMGFKFE